MVAPHGNAPSMVRLSLLPLAAVALSVALVAPEPAQGQQDSVTVVAGEHYEAGGLHALLLGREYRDLWTTPIRVPVLDLGSFAGGLTPVERGGGLQTISLRFRGADGREYNFRSVDKDQGGGMHPDFQNTLVDRVAQDQVSSKHPASAVIADPLLEAAGVLHPRPTLFVMPDDPRLGEFREQFAGMLGMLEVHPNEGENDTPGFAGSSLVDGTEDVLDLLEQSPAHRVDAREYLRARLMDLFLGDWDRHIGQWRWARFPDDGGYRWVVVPEDRDNALASYDGLVMDAIRRGAPRLVEFGPSYPSLYGLTENAQQLDRRLLSELPRAAFDSLAAELQGRLTDAVIADAVRRAPPEYHERRGAEIARSLQARRDALPEIAGRFYAQLAREVEVRATDEPELATVDRLADGSVEVRLHAGTDAADRPYFRRRFLPGETREVRIFLHGGNDRAVVRGSARRSLLVRVIGGGGDDVLADSSRGGSTHFYDHRGDNRFVAGRGTRVDQREFTPPEAAETGFNENTPAFRDWGRQVQWFRPWAEWRYNVGLVVGGGPQVTRYGFRRAPYAHRVGARALYAPLENRFGLELAGDFRRTGNRSRISVGAHATQLEVTRYHGFGNQTPSEGHADLFKVWETEYRLETLYHRRIGEPVELFAGPVVEYSRPAPHPEGPAGLAAPFGSEPYGQVGARAGAVADTRDLASFPRRGVLALLSASAFPGVWDAPGAFGGADATAAAYLPLPLPLETTLALRLGGALAWGDFPFQDAAFVGGSGSLRGYPRQRYAGDAAAFGGVELRTFLTRFNFISRGDLGLIALADAGRVFVEGEDSDRWHTGLGGGVWVGILDRTRTFSVVVASGEETAAYVALGMPF